MNHGNQGYSSLSYNSVWAMHVKAELVLYFLQKELTWITMYDRVTFSVKNCIKKDKGLDFRGASLRLLFVLKPSLFYFIAVRTGSMAFVIHSKGKTKCHRSEEQ